MYPLVRPAQTGGAFPFSYSGRFLGSLLTAFYRILPWAEGVD